MATNIRINAQDFVKLVQELQQRLQTESDRIGELTPEQQIVQTQSETLRAEGAILLDLQMKVQTYVLGQPGITIVGLNSDQLAEIQEKLESSASILEGLEDDNALALELADVSQLTQSLLSNPNPTQASSLLNRVQQASSSHGVNNHGANVAVETLESALKALTQPAQNGSRQPIRQVPRQTQPAQPLPWAPTPPSYNQNGALEKERQLKDAQDQDFQCSKFNDEFKDIEKKLTKDPIKDFDMVLAHYKAVHGYVINVPIFRSEDACSLFQGMRTQLKQSLEKYIKEQAAKEASAPAPQVQAQPQGQTGVLNKLKDAIEAYKKNSNAIDTFKKAAEGLSDTDKKRIFDALNEVRKGANLNPFPDHMYNMNLKKQNLQQWSGTTDHKLMAVQKVIASSPSSPAQPAAPATPPAPKKSDEMRKRFNEVQNMLPVAQPSRNSSSSPSLQIPGLSAEEYAWINGDTSSGQAARQGNATSLHPHVATMQRLQHLLQSITPELTEYQLGRIVTDLYNLVSEGKKSIFQMSGSDLRLIGDRPFFHLYFIHKNEAPEILKEDMEYGGKAFAGAIPGTTHLERMRCLSRALVELLLENIEGAINFDNGELLVRSLDILEGIELYEKDRAEGHKNVAHQLFGAFYLAHVAARDGGNGSLVDPSDSRFQNDFGRHAFRGKYDGVDQAIKLQVIAQERNALKAAWKL